jgi:lipid-binding SYLF domain-containing protein
MEKIPKPAITVISILNSIVLGGKYSVAADEMARRNELASKATFKGADE